MISPWFRVLSARYVVRLVEHFEGRDPAVAEQEIDDPRVHAPEAEPDAPIVTVRGVGGVLFMSSDPHVADRALGVPHVEPLGLAQVNQSHDSYRDSPAANVLLMPSVTSRIETVAPSGT